MKTILSKILKCLGVGLIAALIAHETKTLFDIKKDNLKMQHRLQKPKTK